MQLRLKLNFLEPRAYTDPLPCFLSWSPDPAELDLGLDIELDLEPANMDPDDIINLAPDHMNPDLISVDLDRVPE